MKCMNLSRSTMKLRTVTPCSTSVATDAHESQWPSGKKKRRVHIQATIKQVKKSFSHRTYTVSQTWTCWEGGLTWTTHAIIVMFSSVGRNELSLGFWRQFPIQEESADVLAQRVTVPVISLVCIQSMQAEECVDSRRTDQKGRCVACNPWSAMPDRPAWAFAIEWCAAQFQADCGRRAVG